jgi:DNA repair exonuclease SbcCD ATPase subunit
VRITQFLTFADFERTLEDLSADDLMKIVRAYLSRGIVACQKGFERAATEDRTSLDKQKFLEEENQRLKEENEKLKRESHLQADQRAKQQEALNALKKELEYSLKCYEECHQELKDMVMQYDAQNILLKANADLIAELKKVKGELEDTLEKNEAYCHQWGHIWRQSIVGLWKVLEPKPRTSKLLIISQASWSGCIVN